MLVSAQALVAWFKARRERRPVVYRERKGELALENDVVLSGIADRIEIGREFAAILDFKTGAPPTDKQVESGLSPQLLLEAAMLKRGVFAETPAARTTGLIYWRFGGADPTPRAVKLDATAQEAGEEALARLRALLKQYERAGLAKRAAQSGDRG